MPFSKIPLREKNNATPLLKLVFIVYRLLLIYSTKAVNGAM